MASNDVEVSVDNAEDVDNEESFDDDDDIDSEEERADHETIFFDGPGFGLFNWNVYTVTNKSIMARTTWCCWRRFINIEMRLISDVQLQQNMCQKRKGAGIITFFTVDPLYAATPLSLLILDAVPVFHKVVQHLKVLREDFSRACGSKVAVEEEAMIYKGGGYDGNCPCHCCQMLSPISYRITTEDLLEQKMCCACTCGGKPERVYPGCHWTYGFCYPMCKKCKSPCCTEFPKEPWKPCCSCSCSNTVNFLSIRRIFQVTMYQGCCSYCCMCCPEAGSITLHTTDNSAGNEFTINLPWKAVKTFQRIRRRVDLETAMLERTKANRMVGMAMSVME